MIKEDKRRYCSGEDVFVIDETTKLIIKSFWFKESFCAHGFIKYDGQDEIKFGCIEMASPSDDFVPTYFKTTRNYVAVCYDIDGEIGVEHIFDVQKKCELPINLTEREEAIINFKRELLEEGLNKSDYCGENPIQLAKKK